MRITILAHGSRGDVQPYLALALGLVRDGHSVRLAAPEIFRAMVETPAQQPGGERLTFAPLAGDPAALMRQAANPGPLKLLPGPVRNGLVSANYVRPVIDALIHDVRAASEDTDLLIHTLLTTIIGHMAARERKIRDLSALVFPVFAPTASFPNPLFPTWPGWAGRLRKQYAGFGPRYNYLTHREFNRVFWHANRLSINLLHRRAGTADLREFFRLARWPFGDLEDGPTPILYGISPSALPPVPEWSGASVLPPDEPYGPPASGLKGKLTGYWFLDAPGWQPPDGLVDFLEAGPPPVFIGFGSLIPKDAARLMKISLDALEQSGQRGILLSGWSGQAACNLPGRVYPLEEAPFDWLYPRMALAVHHGGMGTTAAALRAGIPSVIIPFAFDQPFWGRQVAALGAGPAAIRPAQLTARKLAEAIRTGLESASIRQNAAALGEKIRQEDGVAEAVQWINTFMGR